MKNNDDIPTTDTNEIKQLINRVKRGELDQGDELLIEKLLNILLMIVSLLQRKHTSIRRMKEFLLGMKEKKRCGYRKCHPRASGWNFTGSMRSTSTRLSSIRTIALLIL
jgi:hypothetical protein